MSEAKILHLMALDSNMNGTVAAVLGAVPGIAALAFAVYADHPEFQQEWKL